MTASIQALPIEVIHLMAAGEVIDSLAAVVRELAENAIDAEATRIHIALWPESWRIRVTDNGSGMDLADLQQAALPHCTSKIHSSADLWEIGSLGFRGEALHSLAQLANLEICSRSLTSDSGYRVCYSPQGEAAQVEPIALATGTIVTASGLFANWVSRQQSLSIAAQLRAVQQTVQELALCHPQITWQVEQNDRPWFAIWGNPAHKFVLAQLLRDVQPSDLQELRLRLRPEFPDAEFPTAEDSVRWMPALYLLLGLPDRCHRRRPDWVKVAVNGRIVALPELEQTILVALRRALPRDRYPVCFLHLQVPPAQVDWNRHPAKSEIYLRQLSDWQQQTQRAIAQLLQSSLTELPDALQAFQLSQRVKVTEADGVYRTSRTIQPEPDSADCDLANGPSLLPLKALAQVHQMYILAEHPSGMWLVEQHIAHERVLYEQLVDQWQLVPLEPPLILAQLTPAQVDQLQRIGIDVESFGEQRWAVRSAPESLATRSDCSDALLELSQGGDLESALVATACRTAIRNGTPLDLTEMQTLLDRWQRTRNPRTCPHGRPIYLALEESSLSRFFRRHWVIGKSHGI